MRNVYHTTDPEILLKLKRQEADALRDVIRSINDPRITINHIFKIAKNTLLAQLGVRKMSFLYETHEGIRTGLHFGFPAIQAAVYPELPRTTAVTRVTPEEHPQLTSIQVEYVVPVNFFERVGAWFLIAEFADSDAERENDLIFIETLANVLSAAIENRQLMEDRVRQESLRNELEVAERIQKQLLVQNFSDIHGADVFAENIAHHKIGGDFYDLIPRGKLGFFVCIADVSGKGIGAALLMANIQANLRALILSQNSLEEILRRLHIIISDITKGDQFVTLFLGHVRLEERMIEYINAGHHPPILAGASGITLLNEGTIPLGILALPHVSQGSVSYQSGDMLFLYTDGLVDQHNPKGEALGEERIMALILEHVSASSAELVGRMRELHREYAGGADHEDDITMVAARLH